MATQWYVSKGSSANAANGGGYDVATYAGTAAQLLAANDGPVAGPTTDATYVLSTGVLTKTGAFTNVLVGMKAHVVSGTNMTAGWYTITARTDNSITIVGAGTNDGDTVVVRVGGAFATVDTALTVASSGDTITVGDGTYSENSGSNYLDVTQDFTSFVTIQAAHTGLAIITGSSSSQVMQLNTCSFLKFVGIKFAATASVAHAAIITIASGNTTDITFQNCLFDDTGRGTNTDKHLFRLLGSTQRRILFSGCTMTLTAASTATSSAPSALVWYGYTTPKYDSVVFDSCIINVTGNHAGLWWNLKASGVLIQGVMFRNCTITQTGTAGTRFFSVGEDGASNAGVGEPGFVFENNTITTTTSSHTLLIGAAAHGARIIGNTFITPNSDYAIANKVNFGTIIRDNVFSGPSTGIINRAAYNFDISNNLFLCDDEAIELEDYNGSSPTYGTGRFGSIFNNILLFNNASACRGIHIATAGMNPDCYVDYNCYWNLGAGVLSPLLVVATTKTLAEAITYWSGTYGWTIGGTCSNDSHSKFTNPMVNTTDYKTLPGSPCINAGRPGYGSQISSIGVWRPRAETFSDRAGADRYGVMVS